MTPQETKSKLYALKLHGMAKAFDDQMGNANAQSLAFENRVGMMVEEETTYRDGQRLQRLLKQARLKERARLEDFIAEPRRGIDREKIANLSTCNWIKKRMGMTLTGPTGSGKTWLACALGTQACREGLSVYFQRLSLLLEDLHLARADGTFKRRILALAKYDLLILDDLGITDTFPAESREHLLEVIEARCGLRSTIVTSQLPVERWHGYLAGGNQTAADAILDRLLSGGLRVELAGESMRKHKALIQDQAA